MNPPSVNFLAVSRNPDGSLPAKRNAAHNHDAFFKSVQWSADGTTLFTSSSSNRICAFVLPETLLDPRPSPMTLAPHSTLALPEPTSAIAPCPYFALDHPATQTLLTASKDHPIHLHHAFPPPSPSARQPPPLASFNLIKPETEAYLPIASLLWPAPGTHFVAGTANLVAVFDVSRPDALRAAPLLSIPTIPSTRHLAKGGGVGMRGTVSALAAQPAAGGAAGGEGWGVVAAGTWTRNLGVYDLARAGACVATWSVAGAAAAGRGGKGVVQTVWSPCGRYLVVNERGATGLLVYDLQGTHRLLACLEGRDGTTNQRLSCDVFPGSGSVGGFEVWAGTKDGGVVVWEGVGNQEGVVRPSWDWQGHNAAVGSTALHMSGSVVATCSGSWEVVDGDDNSGTSDSSDSSGTSDSSDDSADESGSGASARIRTRPQSQVVVHETSLKIWSIGPSVPSQAERESQDEGDAAE
ncbi:hypothetical protein BT67DRAFT_496073 [Trichocladium antarcticum]|uniref:WD repeat-containing protein n=1 Tax=Trichocladium antarcticum TaxID=1450529 RepID=A0AAN6UK55_9PEZI|nr:hypothetical protein BT67DRAFT_496073 [Trichocladium antarcticum]